MEDALSEQLVDVYVPDEEETPIQPQLTDPSVVARRNAGNRRVQPAFDPMAKGQIRGPR